MLDGVGKHRKLKEEKNVIEAVEQKRRKHGPKQP